MYIRVTRAQLDPTKLDEFVPIDQEVASIIKTLPGFLSFMRGTCNLQRYLALIFRAMWRTFPIVERRSELRAD